MAHRHIGTITFGTCLVIFARTCTHTNTHTHFNVGTGTVGLPSLQALVGGGGRLCCCHTFFRGGGLENYLGRGGGGST